MSDASWLRHIVQAALTTLGLAAAYAALIGLLAWQQERLIFFPQGLPADHRFELAADVQEHWIDVPGARLNALHLRRPRPDGVVFFLHGNAGNLDSWFVDLDFYRRANVDLFMIDYRGYGKSTGRIENEVQLHADVRAAWQSIAPAYAGQRRVFFGRSLGTALAARLAAEVQPELTVLVSPFISLQTLAREHYPWVPAAVLRYALHTDKSLPQIRGRVLLVHGELDTLIEPRHSTELQRLRPQSELVTVRGAGHNDLQDAKAYRTALQQALRP